MLSTELSTGILFVTLAIAIVAFIGAYSSFHFAMRLSREKQDFRKMLLWIQELDDNHEALSASHKRLRSRVGMQDLRAKRKNVADDEPETPEPMDQAKWKRDMRARLHTGHLKP